jgi:hypothetical protein
MINQTLSHYRTIERLGGGGTGVVGIRDNSSDADSLPRQLHQDQHLIDDPVPVSRICLETSRWYLLV